MSSLYTEEGHASVYVCEHWKRGAAGRERREKKRPAFAGTNVSARNNQSGKEENSTPEQAEHKVNVEVLGEQTACLIVWLMRLKRRPSAAQHNSSGCKCHLENAPGCLFKGQASGCTHSLRWRWRSLPGTFQPKTYDSYKNSFFLFWQHFGDIHQPYSNYHNK